MDFLAIIEWRRAEGTNGYGMLYELSGMPGEPGIADLQAFRRPRRPLGREGPSRSWPPIR